MFWVKNALSSHERRTYTKTHAYDDSKHFVRGFSYYCLCRLRFSFLHFTIGTYSDLQLTQTSLAFVSFSILFLCFSFVLCLPLASVWVFCFSFTFCLFRGTFAFYRRRLFVCAVCQSPTFGRSVQHSASLYLWYTNTFRITSHTMYRSKQPATTEVNSQPQPNIHVYWTLLDCCFVHVMIMNERARDSERCVRMYNV